MSHQALIAKGIPAANRKKLCRNGETRMTGWSVGSIISEANYKVQQQHVAGQEGDKTDSQCDETHGFFEGASHQGTNFLPVDSVTCDSHEVAF